MSFKFSGTSDLSVGKRLLMLAAALATIGGAVVFKLNGYGFGPLMSGTSTFHTIAVLVCVAAAAVALPFLGKLSAEKNFLVIWTLLSLVYVFSGTVLKTPDETGHFYRSFEISCGYAVSEVQEGTAQGGRELPLDVDVTLLEKSWRSFSENKDMSLTENKPFIVFTNLSLYCPVSYLPQAVGIFTARLFTKNVAAIAYAGRLANWLTITLMLFIAVKTMPVKKELLLLIALLPMNVYLAFSLSPDGLVVALSLLMFAYVMYLRFEQAEPLSVRQYILLYIMALVICLLKIVYLPICMVYFLIPAERFGSMKSKIIHAVIMASAAVACNLVWLMICKKFLTIPGTDANEQLRYMMSDPLNYVTVMVRTAIHYGVRWALMMIGGYLGTIDIETSKLLAFAYLFMLVIAFIDIPAIIAKRRRGGTSEKAVWSENIVFGVIVFAILMLINASLYMQWTPPHSPLIKGIQGRYFIALLLPLYFTIHNPTKTVSESEPAGEARIFFCEYLITLVNVCAGVDVLLACL